MLDLKDNFFYNNTVKNHVDNGVIMGYGDGGAIYNSCPTDQIGCISNFTNNYFDFNSAEHDGGAVKWSGYEPWNLTTNNTYGSSNTAAYGNNYAAFAIGLAKITKESFDSNNLDDTTRRRLTTVDSMSEVASG